LKAGLQAAAGAIVLTGSSACTGGSGNEKPMSVNWTLGEDAAQHEAWLAQTIEAPLEPELEICDPHHHMWDRPGTRYLVDELLADAADHNLVDTVFVECQSGYREEGPPEMAPVGETEFMEEVALGCAADPECRTAVAEGIVGHVDLTLGDAVAPVLEAHLEASPERFRGIRLAQLDRLGLSFDSWAYFTQLTELADVARAFPELIIICDHAGGVVGIGPYAGRRDEAFWEWRHAIKGLAAHANVFMKLGGLAMPLSGFGWHERALPPGSEELAEATAPYYLACIEAFGVERCMFESNFPVDKVSCSYTVLWNSFKRVVQGFSADEKAWLFHDAAARAYRIPALPSS
jgi:predicted TIM-barrel fold metal-dependent hydrolase